MAEGAFADVALPVPLARLFTYRAPPAFALQAGMRVAVPFSGQKLTGFVVRTHDTAPEGVKLRDVAFVLEPEPVFPEELLRFLLRAADYYLAPVGEVLKTAAPLLSRDAAKALKKSGFVEREDELKSRTLSTRTTWRVRALAAPTMESLRLGARQRALLALLAERGEILLTELNQHIPNARGVVKALSERQLLTYEVAEVVGDHFFSGALREESPFIPNAEQAHAITALSARLFTAQPGAALLHGVTGSGKTEVYLQVVQHALNGGGGALVLVPEIALTPQLVARFRARFGEGIAVLHSGLSDRARNETWRALRRGALRLAIGARSALFAPVPRLAVIIVDEEHDPSFKQEDGFRYHGKDMALLRAHLSGALCVLGSATPSLESYFLAQRGRLELLTLRTRARQQQMPTVEVVDLARYPGPGPSGHPLLTGPLHHALHRCLAAGEQAILFLNRRGFAPSLRCRACAELLCCPACSVTLTEHRRAGLLRCHYCDFAMQVSEACPRCGALALERLGVGTERIEDALAQAFQGARVARLDRDTAHGRGVEEVLERMRERKLDVLVGTQMVTKGHDLPGVTLVGILWADQSLAFPDFRASERTFQLLAQVAGRAGRAELPGRVLLQTYQPSHFAVRSALHHDYTGFYEQEIAQRRELGYAPFTRLVAVRIDAADERVVHAVSERLAQCARACPEIRAREVVILGPAPAPIARIRGRYRMRFLLRAQRREPLRRVAQVVAARIQEGVVPARAHIDVDPVSML